MIDLYVINEFPVRIKTASKYTNITANITPMAGENLKKIFELQKQF